MVDPAARPDDAAAPHPGAVQAFFDSRSYLNRNPIIPVRARIVAGFLAGLRHQRVLDLGCGDGSISRPLLAAANRVTLVDFAPQMLQSARAGMPPGADVEFVESDILEFVPAQPYDAVICVGVLAHVASVEVAMARVAAALRPGGLAVVQISDDSAPLGRALNRYYRRRNRERYALNLTTLSGLKALARDQGLVTLRSRRYGLLLPGLGRLPYEWELRAEMTVAARPRLARVAAEVLVCFSRSGDGSASGGGSEGEGGWPGTGRTDAGARPG